MKTLAVKSQTFHTATSSQTDMSSKARDIKERVNKWDHIKIKSFCTAKENTSKMKREPTVWEIYLPMIPRMGV